MLEPAEMVKLALLCKTIYQAVDENGVKERKGSIPEGYILKCQKVFDDFWATQTVLEDPSQTRFEPSKQLSCHFHVILHAHKKPESVSFRIQTHNSKRYEAAGLTDEELKALDLHALSKYDRNMIYNTYTLKDLAVLT